MIFDDRDAKFLSRQHADLYRAAFRKVEFYVRDREVSSVDTLYNEDEYGDLTKGPRHDIRLMVKLNPPQQEWSRFGLSERRDLRLNFSKRLLSDGYVPTGGTFNIPFPTPKRGDVVRIEGELYNITDLFNQDYFATGELAMTLVAFAVRVRLSHLPSKEAILPESAPESLMPFPDVLLGKPYFDAPTS